MKDKEKNIKIYLSDILESVEKIEDYTKEVSEKDFFNDTQVQDSVLKRLEVIGEAVNNIPKEFQDKHQSVPWRKIVGMRNILIHKYFGVNIKRVWKVVKNDLPDLKKNIKRIKKDL